MKFRIIIVVGGCRLHSFYIACHDPTHQYCQRKNKKRSEDILSFFEKLSCFHNLFIVLILLFIDFRYAKVNKIIIPTK